MVEQKVWGCQAFPSCSYEDNLEACDYLEEMYERRNAARDAAADEAERRAVDKAWMDEGMELKRVERTDGPEALMALVRSRATRVRDTCNGYEMAGGKLVHWRNCPVHGPREWST